MPRPRPPRPRPPRLCPPHLCFLLPSSLWKHRHGVSARSFHGTCPPTIKQATPQASTERPLMCLQPPGPTTWGECHGPRDRPTLGRCQYSQRKHCCSEYTGANVTWYFRAFVFEGHPYKCATRPKWVLMPFSSMFRSPPRARALHTPTSVGECVRVCVCAWRGVCLLSCQAHECVLI